MKVLYATLLVVIADQSTKLMVRGVSIPWLGIDFAGMPLYSSKEILGNLVRLTYVKNPGTAFGLGPGFTVFFAVFSLLASIAIFAYMYRIRGQGLGMRLAFALILGGAVGNMLDRVFLGSLLDGGSFFNGRVIDFIDVNILRLPFVFNLADASVTAGVIMLIFFQRRLIYRTSGLGMGEVEDAALPENKGSSGDVGNRGDENL